AGGGTAAILGRSLASITRKVERCPSFAGDINNALPSATCTSRHFKSGDEPDSSTTGSGVASGSARVFSACTPEESWREEQSAEDYPVQHAPRGVLGKPTPFTKLTREFNDRDADYRRIKPVNHSRRSKAESAGHAPGIVLSLRPKKPWPKCSRWPG